MSGFLYIFDITMWPPHCSRHIVALTMWPSQCGPHNVAPTMWPAQYGIGESPSFSHSRNDFMQ